MNTDQNRALLAAGLAAVVLIGWQFLFPVKNVTPPPQANLLQEIKQEKVISNNSSSVGNTKSQIAQNNNQNYNHSSVTLVNGDYSYTVFTDLSFSEAEGFHTKFSLESFSGFKNFFKIILTDANNNILNPYFSFEEIANASTLTGYDNNLGLRISFNLNSDGRLDYKIDSNEPIKANYKFLSSEKTSANKTARQFATFSNETDFYVVEDSDSQEGSLKWFGLDFSHHLFAVVLPLKEIFSTTFSSSGEMFVKAISPKKEHKGYIIYSLKDYEYLMSFNDKLDLSIDFGIFGILAVPILKALKYLFSYLGNYGWAILILTFAIRLLTFPLQQKSFKSMKKMQKVQPELAKLKEKFKDNPQRMQKETMELFKRAGANPLGGCLPMLLQVPIFIAFYQAINNSVELVGSPFIFWITDLSSKDPYYVFPILMGLTMLAQTKLNPSTTADPNQQKIMYIMPLVFCFIMKDLPAGLNLYFFFSNVLGIAQQLLVYRMED